MVPENSGPYPFEKRFLTIVPTFLMDAGLSRFLISSWINLVTVF